MFTSEPPLGGHLKSRTGPVWTPPEKMPVNDPTPRIILRLVVLSGGKTGVKKALCRSWYEIGENRVE